MFFYGSGHLFLRSSIRNGSDRSQRICILNFSNCFQIVLQQSVPLYIPTGVEAGFLPLYTPSPSVSIQFYNFCHSNGSLVFYLIDLFLITNEVKHLFINCQSFLFELPSLTCKSCFKILIILVDTSFQTATGLFTLSRLFYVVYFLPR